MASGLPLLDVLHKGYAGTDEVVKGHERLWLRFGLRFQRRDLRSGPNLLAGGMSFGQESRPVECISSFDERLRRCCAGCQHLAFDANQ